MKQYSHVFDIYEIANCLIACNFAKFISDLYIFSKINYDVCTIQLYMLYGIIYQ